MANRSGLTKIYFGIFIINFEYSVIFQKNSGKELYFFCCFWKTVENIGDKIFSKRNSVVF